MVKGMNVVNLLFLVGFCWVEVGADSKMTPPPTSQVYFPTDDGCYSYPANIEPKCFTLSGKTFKRAVSPYKCMDEGTKSDAESFWDCAQQAIDGEYNSFYYDGNNTECSMHLFWVPKDNPLSSLDNPANEYYTKRASYSGSVTAIVIDLTPNVLYPEEKVLYISEEMNTEYAANDKLNPVVKPSIKEFSYNITGKYEIINATAVLEGTTCLAEIYLVEDDEISGDFSLDYESTEVAHIYRNINDPDSGCDTGDVYVFLDIIGDGDEVYPSAGVENVVEEQKKYIRSAAMISAIEPSLEWRSDATNKNIVRTILRLSGDTSLVSKATVKYGDENANEITTITSEMVTSYTDDDEDCSDLDVDVQLFDLYECQISDTTFMRSDLVSAFDGKSGIFDACAVVGFVDDNREEGVQAKAFCDDEDLTLPILKTEADLAVFKAKSDRESWLGFVNYTFVWQDDGSDTLSSDVFNPTEFTQAPDEECSLVDGGTPNEKLTLIPSSCTGSKRTICWKLLEVLNVD